MAAEKLRLVPPEDRFIALLANLDVEITGETSTHFIGYCPFHENRETPAFNIDKELGVWRCWNPACAASGQLMELVQTIKKISPVESTRYVLRFCDGDIPDIKKKIRLERYEDYLLDEIQELELSYDIDDLRYLLERGLSEQTIRYFGAGWDGIAICIPVKDEFGRLVGYTRRVVSGDGPKYKDTGLKKSRVLFGIDKAVSSNRVVVVEGPIDAMKVVQAGYHCVATMMGALSKYQASILLRRFDVIDIFTDNDEAGRKLGESIQDICAGKKIYWVPYLYDVKDPGAMNDDQIRDCMSARILTFLAKLRSSREDVVSSTQNKHQGGNV